MGECRGQLAVIGAISVGDLVEPLPWDTEFFGVPIGRVTLDGSGAVGLDEIDDEARDLGVECLFGTLDPEGDPQRSFHVESAGHRLTEVSLLFDRPAASFVPPSTRSVVRRGTEEDLEMLSASGDTLAPWSRFAVDPRFGLGAARRMHAAWVRRAAEEPGERLLLIAEDESGVTGISTNVRSPVPRVDLMGVVKPGTGASWALLGALLDWAGGGETQAGPCAARNIAPLRFLEHCGYQMTRSRYLYHRWLDEADR